jgi:hypothetical protein
LPELFFSRVEAYAKLPSKLWIVVSSSACRVGRRKAATPLASILRVFAGVNRDFDTERGGAAQEASDIGFDKLSLLVGGYGIDIEGRFFVFEWDWEVLIIRRWSLVVDDDGGGARGGHNMFNILQLGLTSVVALMARRDALIVVVYTSSRKPVSMHALWLHPVAIRANPGLELT